MDNRERAISARISASICHQAGMHAAADLLDIEAALLEGEPERSFVSIEAEVSNGAG